MKAVLSGPDVVTRMAAVRRRTPSRRWRPGPGTVTCQCSTGLGPRRRVRALKCAAAVLFLCFKRAPLIASPASRPVPLSASSSGPGPRRRELEAARMLWTHWQPRAASARPGPLNATGPRGPVGSLSLAQWAAWRPAPSRPLNVVALGHGPRDPPVTAHCGGRSSESSGLGRRRGWLGRRFASASRSRRHRRVVTRMMTRMIARRDSDDQMSSDGVSCVPAPQFRVRHGGGGVRQGGSHIAYPAGLGP